jgi:hypothetical protein
MPRETVGFVLRKIPERNYLCHIANNFIMKKTNILYWVFTGLFAAFMFSTAIPNIILDAESITLIKSQLGYPEYFIPFIGVAKVLGVIGILIPGFPRVKEWAYAGLFFDLAGATYSVIAMFGLQPDMAFMILPFGFFTLSYIFHHKRLRGEAVVEGATVTAV